jgi:ABC-type uncharacterized transport system permease subunit
VSRTIERETLCSMFTFKQNILTINAIVANYKDSPMRLELVRVLGVSKAVTSVLVNGKDHKDFSYNISDQVRFLIEYIPFFILLHIVQSCVTQSTDYLKNCGCLLCVKMFLEIQVENKPFWRTLDAFLFNCN